MARQFLLAAEQEETETRVNDAEARETQEKGLARFAPSSPLLRSDDCEIKIVSNELWVGLDTQLLRTLAVPGVRRPKYPQISNQRFSISPLHRYFLLHDVESPPLWR